MSNKVTDPTLDSNGWMMNQILKAQDKDGVNLFTEPDFVKTASREQLVGGVEQPAGVFADPAARKFACHTAAATWLSAVAFHTQKQAYGKNKMKAVSDRLDSVARFHGISGAVEQVKQAAARYLDDSLGNLPDSDFALVLEIPGLARERHMPIRNAQEIKTACAYLETHRNAFTFEDRRNVAEKILIKAASLEVELENQAAVERQAGRGTCSAKSAAELLFSRARALRQLGKDLDGQEKLAQIALRCLENPEFIHLPSNLRKVASLVDRIDQERGLVKLSSLRRPEDCLFAISLEAAAEIERNHVSFSSGNIYTKEAVARLPLASARSLLGEEFSRAVTFDGLRIDTEKLAQVAPTMPRADAELFDRLAAANGIDPVYREPARERSGLSAEAIEGLAGSYAGAA